LPILFFVAPSLFINIRDENPNEIAAKATFNQIGQIVFMATNDNNKSVE